METDQKYVFIKDPTEIYRAVRVVVIDAAKQKVSVSDLNDSSNSVIATVNIADTYPIDSIDELTNPPADLIKLRVVNLPGILNSLRHRFKRDLIYTSVGPILVALNPFKWIKGIYDESVMMKYFKEEIDLNSDPHVFAISNEAFQGLRDKLNQSLVISGESGAGKTETTKQCLNYLAHIAGSSSGVQNRILLASPILEAWGNAKTLRNNNSSRFGKFIEIWFDRDSRIVGSSNTTYLLEKSRVVFQDKNERNYHVFYQLLKGGDPRLLEMLRLNDMARRPDSVNYINQSGCIDIEDVDDSKDYHEVQRALSLLGFSSKECEQLWIVVAAVLHLGNIEYIPNPGNSDEAMISVDYQKHLDVVVELIGVDHFILTQSLLKKKIQTGGKRASVSYSPYTVALAIETRNSLAKEIYNRTFDWIVYKINSFVNAEPTAKRFGMIGVLDIFGFEIFKKNSFEQLCINLANEALQQHFNVNIFRVEMELYRTEDIPIPDISFNDNQDVLDLIMKRPTGIIPVLDEEGLIPKGSWEGFLSKIIKIHHPGNKRFKNKQLTREFSVVHYAGEVTYDPKLFLAKNKDTLAQEIVDELRFAKVELFAEIFRMSDIDESLIAESSPSSSKRSSTSNPSQTNKTTIGKKFSLQLDSLIVNLNNTKPHYIRCIKPNDVKKPDIFMPGLTNEQLTYSGVFEAVIILQSGYPFRLSLFEFRARFHMLVLDKNGRSQIFDPRHSKANVQPPINEGEAMRLRAQCGNLVSLAIQKGHGIMKDSYLGKSKVFYRAPVHYYLVRVRNEIIFHGARTLQRYARGYIIRKLYRLIKETDAACAKAMFARNMKAMSENADSLEKIFDRLNRCTPSIIQLSSAMAVMSRGLVDALLVEIEVVEQLKTLLKNRSQIFNAFDDIVNALNKAKAIISFKGKVDNVEITHTWEQNAYLVSASKSIGQWERLATVKKEILRALSVNDEVSLEESLAEIESMKSHQDGLDGVIDVTDILEPLETMISTSKISCNNFILNTLPKYNAGHVKITPNQNEYDIAVDDEVLKSVIDQYANTTPEISSITASRRVKVSLDCYRRINAMRTLIKNKCWKELWMSFSSFTHLVTILDAGVWSSLSKYLESETLATPSTSQAKSFSFLQSTDTLPMGDVLAIPPQIAMLLRVEIVDIMRATIDATMMQVLEYALSQNGIPGNLFLIPSNSKIDVSEVSRVITDLQQVNKIFDTYLKKKYNKANEHLQLRLAFLTGKRTPLFHALRAVSLIDATDPDRANAELYEKLYGAYEQAITSIFEDGVCIHGKLPGFLDLICDYKPLASAIDVLKELTVSDTYWKEFILIIQHLQNARADCLSNSYEKASLEISSLFGKAWWMGLSTLGSVSSVTTSDPSQASITDAILTAKHELKSIHIELKHRLAVSAIGTACGLGRIIGSFNRLDYTALSDIPLVADLAKYRQDVVPSTIDARIVQDCDNLVLLRRHIIASDWNSLSDAIIRLYKTTNAFADCHPATKLEFVLCYHSYLDRQALHKLEASTVSHRIILTQDNDVDNTIYMDSKPSFDALNDSIRQAESLEYRSDECSSLLEAVKKLLGLRIAVRTDYWDKWKLRVLPPNKWPMEKLCKEILNNQFSDKDAEFIATSLSTPSPKQSKLNFSSACVEEIIDSTIDELPTYPLPALAKEEFYSANQVLLERRCRTLILIGALAGQITLTLGSLEPSTVSYKALTKAIWLTKTTHSNMSSILSNWLQGAELLLNLRIAVCSSKILSSDSINIETYVDTFHLKNSLDRLHVSFPRREIVTAIEAIIDLRNFNALLLEFDKGRPILFTGQVDVSYVHYDGMLNVFNIIRKETKSDRVDRLMFYANLCIHLRRAMVRNHWDTTGDSLKIAEGESIDLQSIKQCLEEYKRSKKFFTTPIDRVPPRQLEEDFQLIELEYYRRNLIQSFSNAFKVGRITGRPLSLLLNRINVDFLSSQIDRVRKWGDEVGEIGSDLTLYINAAEEIRALRLEAIEIQSSFSANRSVRVAGEGSESPLSFAATLSQSIASDAVRLATTTISSIVEHKGYVHNQWKNIQDLITALTFSHSLPILNAEISLLTVESFSRKFIQEMSSILVSAYKYDRKKHLQELDKSHAETILTSIQESCTTYSLLIGHSPELTPKPESVLTVIFSSVSVLYFMYLAEINGCYEKPRRNWKDPSLSNITVSTLSQLLLNSTAKTSSISMQSIIRAVESYSSLLHYSIGFLKLMKEKYIEDIISFQEMSESVKSTALHLNSISSDTDSLVDFELIDVGPLRYAKERMDTVGVTETGIANMKASFEFLIDLRSSLLQRDIAKAFALLDDWICDGKRDLFDLLRITSSATFKYPAHVTFKDEISTLIKVIIDKYVQGLAEDALNEGYLIGKRCCIDITNTSWRKLDVVTRYSNDEFKFPWSTKTNKIFRLCFQVTNYRKSISQFDSKLSIKPLDEEITSNLHPINLPSSDIRAFLVINDVVGQCLNSLPSMKSNFFSDLKLYDKLLAEVSLVYYHVNFMIAATNLTFAAATRVIEFNEGGLVVPLTIYQIWKTAITEFKALNKRSGESYGLESWFLALYSFMQGVINIVENIDSISQSLPDRTISVDIEALSLDQRITFPASEIENLLRDITNSNSSISIPEPQGDSHLITVSSNIAFLSPGTSSFIIIVPLIDDCLKSYQELVDNYVIAEGPLTQNFATIHSSLESSLLEHQTVNNMLLLISSYEFQIVTSDNDSKYYLKLNESIKQKNMLSDFVASLSYSSDDFEDAEVSFPWLYDWLGVGIKEPQSTTRNSSVFPLELYRKYTTFLQNTRHLKTTLGCLCRTVSRLFVELRWCSVTEEWSRGQVIGYLLTHLTVMDDISVQDAHTFRLFVDRLTLKRQLEYGIMACIVPPVVGWTSCSIKDRILLTINDFCLSIAISRCEDCFPELLRDQKSPYLGSLVSISKALLEVVAHIRTGRWDGDTSAIEPVLVRPYFESLSENSKFDQVEKYISGQRPLNTASLRLALVKLEEIVTSNRSPLHTTLKPFLRSQILNIRREMQYLELFSDVQRHISEVFISGQPGRILISNSTYMAIESIVSILSSPNAIETIKYSIELARTYQSFYVVLYCIKNMILDQTCEEIEHAVALLRNMSKMPSFYSGDTNLSLIKTDLHSFESIRTLSDKQLDTFFKEAATKAEKSNTNAILDYIKCSGDCPSNVSTLRKLPKFEAFNETLLSVTSNSPLADTLLQLHPKLMMSVDLFENNLILIRIINDFNTSAIQGSAKGAPGELFTDDNQFELLDKISSQLLLSGLVSKEDVSGDVSVTLSIYVIIYRACVNIRRLRQAQKENNISLLCQIFDSIESSIQAEIRYLDAHLATHDDSLIQATPFAFLTQLSVQKEIELAQRDWEQRHLIIQFQSSFLSNGIPLYEISDSDGLPLDSIFAEVNVQDLDTALKLCTQIQPICPIAVRYHATAIALYNIRTIFKKKEWNELAEYVDSLNVNEVDTSIMPEIIRAKRAGFMYSALKTVLSSYKSGAFVPPGVISKKLGVEAEKKAVVSIVELEKAYDLLSRIHESWRTDVIQRHLDSCLNLLELRKQIIAENWQVVHALATMILNPIRSDVKQTYQAVLAEAQGAKDHASEIIAQGILKKAIITGRATGEGGKLDLIQLSTSHLQSAIVLANELQVKGKDTLRLLNTAKIAQRLRLAQSRDFWINKGTIVKQPTGENSSKKSTKSLPVNVEHAIIKYGRMTVEAAILEAEAFVGTDNSEGKGLNSIQSSPQKSASWMNKMFPDVKGNTQKKEIPKSILSPTETDHYVPEKAESESKAAPAWMQAVDYLPYEACELNISSDKKVETVEDILSEIEKKSNIGISSDIFDEIALARDELLFRRIVFGLLVGLRTRGPGGLPGSLDLSTINTSTLGQVIAYAEQYPILSSKSRCKYLLRDAKHLLSARLKRLQMEWKKLKTVIDAVKDINDLHGCPPCYNSPAATTPLITPVSSSVRVSLSSAPNASQQTFGHYQPVFRSVWEELRMYDSDLAFQVCLASFAEEMNRKIEYMIPSALGALDLSPVLPLIELTRKTKAAAMIYPSTEYDRLLEALNLAIELRARRVYEPNKSTKDLMDKTNIIRARDVRTQLPSYVSFLLNDVTHMSTATDKQQQIQALELAIVTGQLYFRCPVGRMNVKEIDTTTLQIIIQTATPLLKTIGSKADLSLIDVANAVVKLRKSLSSNNWNDIRHIIEDNYQLLQIPLVKEEIDRLLVEADNYDACESFKQVFQMQGRYIDAVKIAKLIYRPKRKRLQSLIDSQYISEPHLVPQNKQSAQENSKSHSKSSDEIDLTIKKLELVIESTKLISIKSEETSMYLKAAELVLRMRRGIVRAAWDEVKNIVFVDANDGLLPDIAMEEIRAVRSGLTYRDVITKIADGMISGAVSGSPGEVDLHSVDFTLLQEAINSSELKEIHGSNDAMSIMYDFAHRLCDIRRAIKENRWVARSDQSIHTVEVDTSILFSVSQESKGKSINDSESPQRLKSTVVEVFKPSVPEAVDEFLRYESNFLNELRRLLQITDDEDESQSESDEDANSVPVQQTIVPFEEEKKKNKESEISSERRRIRHRETDWLVHQWEAVKACRREVRLVLWEIKERKLRERLISAIEEIPAPALKFTTSLQAKSNLRDEYFFASRGNIVNSRLNQNISKESGFSTNESDPFLIRHLEETVVYLKSQYASADVVSEEISSLLVTADIILKFRRAISSGIDLNDYKLLVDEATDLRSRNKMNESVGIVELRAYMSASITVELVRYELVKAVTSGKVRGYIDDLDVTSVETKSLSHWLSASRILAETAQELAIGLIAVVREAEILLLVRTAVKLGQWSELHSVWKSLFTTSNTLREDVNMVYIKEEICHVNAAHRLRDLIKQLESILHEDFDTDLENKFSILMVKSVHLGSTLGQLKQLFSYSCPELMPSTNGNSFPISPSHSAIKLFQCGQVTVNFWNAVCHKFWGDDLLASGDLDDMPLPEDPLLRTVVTRFIQDNLSSTALQAAASTLKSFSSQPTSWSASITSAQSFVTTFHEIGDASNTKTPNKKAAATRRVSVSSVPIEMSTALKSPQTQSAAQSVFNSPNHGLPLATPSRGRRTSVADAFKECRRNSLRNARLQSTIIHQRAPSVYKSIDRPRISVLEILATSQWKDFPDQIRKQFDSARNIVIDRALRLRLISCCATGEVTTDEIGNLIVPDLNDSLELLHLAMVDETVIIKEALDAFESGTTTVHLSWSAETVKWLRTSKVLLSCRSAVIDYRINDLVTELVSAGFCSDRQGYYDTAASFISELTIHEFRIMEAFAIENLAEQTIETAVNYIISKTGGLTSKPSKRSTYPEITADILKEPPVLKLFDLREPLYKRLEHTSYYKLLAKLTLRLIEAIEASIMGNQYRVLRAQEALLLSTTISPHPLSELKDELEHLFGVLFHRAVVVSNSPRISLEHTYMNIAMISPLRPVKSEHDFEVKDTSSSEQKMSFETPRRNSVTESSDVKRSSVVTLGEDFDAAEAGDVYIENSPTPSAHKTPTNPFSNSALRSLFGSAN